MLDSVNSSMFFWLCHTSISGVWLVLIFVSPGPVCWIWFGGIALDFLVTH